MSSQPISRRNALQWSGLLGASSYWHLSHWLSACSQPDPSPAQLASAAAAGATSPQPSAATAETLPTEPGARAAAPSAVAPARTQASARAAGPAAPAAPAQHAIDIDADAGAGPRIEQPIRAIWDPKRSWYMQNEYAPVADEREAFELEVIGSIPPELDGLYVRNGANPANGDAGHWFAGQGMLHGVRIQRGKALWYRNRYVRTPALQKKPVANPTVLDNLPALDAPLCNVNLVDHASRLLAIGEMGFPFEIARDDLSTLGKYDFGGKLTTSFTAHPKVDAVSGEMLAYAYTLQAPFLRYFRIDRQGALVQSEEITLPLRADAVGSNMVMMHDFAITETHVIFLHLPIVLDLQAALSGAPIPFTWDESNGSHLGVMPRNGKSSDVIWIEVEPCFIFHTVNAYNTADGKIALEALRMDPPVWAMGKNSDYPVETTFTRYSIDLAERSARRQTLDDRELEFPTIDRRLVGRKQRYSYMLRFPDEVSPFVERVLGVVKYDAQRDSSTFHEFDPALRPDEAFFVPASQRAAEDEGYLMTYVNDQRNQRSALFILDATNLSAPPIAQIRLPFRVPSGFHGLWVPA